MNVLFVCSYGQVRSITMRNRYALKFDGYSEARGVFNYLPGVWEQELPRFDKIIICNSNSYDEQFNDKHNYPEDRREDLWNAFQKHKDKIIVCRLGKDVWGKPGHPELVKLCDEWLEENKQLFEEQK